MKLKENQKIIISITGIAICIFILYLLNNYSKSKEAFIPSLTPVIYSESTINEYNNYKKIADAKSSIHLNAKAEDLAKFGVPENSVKQYISTGSWPWSPGFINALKQYMMNEPNKTPTSVTEFIVNAQKIWPEQILLLSVQNQFTTGFTNIAKTKNLTCNIDSITKKPIGDSMYTLDPSGNITTTAVDNAQLPTLIPGFKFLSNPCNPCDIFNGNYDCPFAYPDINGQTLFPGFLMDYAWGISADSQPNKNTSISSSLNNLF